MLKCPEVFCRKHPRWARRGSVGFALMLLMLLLASIWLAEGWQRERLTTVWGRERDERLTRVVGVFGASWRQDDQLLVGCRRLVNWLAIIGHEPRRRRRDGVSTVATGRPGLQRGSDQGSGRDGPVRTLTAARVLAHWGTHGLPEAQRRDRVAAWVLAVPFAGDGNEVARPLAQIGEVPGFTRMLCRIWPTLLDEAAGRPGLEERLARLAPTARGLFGPFQPLDAVARIGRGVLLPVDTPTGQHWLFWDLIGAGKPAPRPRRPGSPRVVAIALFRRVSDAEPAGLADVLRRSRRWVGDDGAVGLLPRLSGLRPIGMAGFFWEGGGGGSAPGDGNGRFAPGGDDGLGGWERLRRLRTDRWVTLPNGWEVHRRTIDADLPYDLLVGLRRPPTEAPLSVWRRALTGLLTGAWSMLAIWWLLQGRPPPLGLRTTLTVQLSALALLPMAAVIVLSWEVAAGLWSTGLDARRRMLQSALEELEPEGDLLPRRFGAICADFLASASQRAPLFATSPAVIVGTHRGLLAATRAGGLPAVCVLQHGPRFECLQTVATGSSPDLVRRRADLLSPFWSSGFDDLLGDQPVPRLRLTNVQRRLQETLRQIGDTGLATAFQSTWEQGRAMSVGGVDPLFIVSFLLARRQTCEGLLTVMGEAGALFDRHFRRELARLERQVGGATVGLRMVRGRSRVVKAVRRGGPPHSDRPAPPSGRGGPVTFAPTGVLDQVVTAVIRTRASAWRVGGDQLAVAIRSRLQPEVILGVSVAIDDLIAARRRVLGFTVSLGLLVVATLAWLTRQLGDRVVTPLTGLATMLRRVSVGELGLELRLRRHDEIGALSVAFSEMVRGLRVRSHLGRFVSGALTSAVADARALRPELSRGTVLVSDIRSFTTISETWPPPVVVTMLNQHLALLASCIRDAGGQIDRFIGDAVVGFFPDRPGEPRGAAAVGAALTIVRRHRAWQERRAAAGEFTFAIGIGLAHGEVMTGALEGEDRAEFVLIGPPRELAERREAGSRYGGHSRIVVGLELLATLPATVQAVPLVDANGGAVLDEGTPAVTGGASDEVSCRTGGRMLELVVPGGEHRV